MLLSLLTSALLLLSSTTLAMPSPSPNANANLEVRQRQQQPITPMSCPDYSRIANYSAIDSNATIRAAFLRGSPQGTDPTRVILDRAFKEFAAKNLMFDAELNERCGNLSTIAMTEVNTNFSMGLVADFKVVPTPGARIGAGIETFTGGFVVLLFIAFGLSI